jgi:thymidine kinase
LDGTFLRTGFECILQLIPKAEKVKKLQAICKDCNQNASFSFRMCNSQSLQVIGGEDLYKPVCRECYNDESLVKEMREAQLLGEEEGLKRKPVDAIPRQEDLMTMTEGKKESTTEQQMTA